MQLPSLVQQACDDAEDASIKLDVFLAHQGTAAPDDVRDAAAMVRRVVAQLVLVEAVQRAGLTFIRTGVVPRDMRRDYPNLFPAA